MVGGHASGGGRESLDGLPCLSSTLLFSNYRDCWFLWHFHRDRTETVTETATETVGFYMMIYRDRPGYRVNSKPTSVILTVSVDHPIKTNSLCNGLCDGLCTVSVDCTIKANSLCAQKVHGRSSGECSPGWWAGMPLAVGGNPWTRANTTVRRLQRAYRDRHRDRSTDCWFLWDDPQRPSGIQCCIQA